MKNNNIIKRIIYFLFAVVLIEIMIYPVFAQEFHGMRKSLSKDEVSIPLYIPQTTYIPCECQTADIDFDDVYYSTPSFQRGEIKTVTVPSGKTSFQAGVYLPYNYSEDTIYNVVIFLQGYEPNGGCSPLKWLKELRLNKACDYLVSHDLTKPFLFFSLPERISRNGSNIAALIAFINNNYNVFTDRDHWAIVGFSSGAEHVKNIAMRELHKSFAYYGMCSDDEGGGDTSYLVENKVRMKLFFTSSGNIVDESGVNEVASFRHAGEYQILFGPFADTTEQWVFDGLGHGSWKTMAGSLIKFLPLCFEKQELIAHTTKDMYLPLEHPFIWKEHIPKKWNITWRRIMY